MDSVEEHSDTAAELLKSPLVLFFSLPRSRVIFIQLSQIGVLED